MDQLRAILETHPGPASSAGTQALEAIYQAAQCALVCTACADACLGEDNVVHLRDCIRLNQECADLCNVVARLLARPGPQDRTGLERALQACVRACQACAEECAGHAGDMAHCRICAETCRACAEACEAMMGALVG